MSDEAQDDDGNGGGSEQIAKVVNGLMKSLDASSVEVKLLSGSAVTGAISGLVIKKKKKKGEVTWIGKVTIETEQGSLQIDCDDVGSINLK